MDLPAEVTRQSIADALGHLDDTSREVRDAAFTSRAFLTPPDQVLPHGSG